MLYHNLLGDIRPVGHNVKSKAKLSIEQNKRLRAVFARMQVYPAKLCAVSDKKALHISASGCPEVWAQIGTHGRSSHRLYVHELKFFQEQN